MYPAGQQVTVRGGAAGQVLEGRSRPGFLDGVLTVVLKLLHLVGPDVVMFGEKDAQQLAIVRAMVSDLNVPVRIESVATVRDPDGMAVSSRNAYLSAAERGAALALSRAMLAGHAAQADGPAAALDAARAELARGERADPPLKTDYLVLADPVTFAEVGPDYAGQALLLVAATVGTTRLIDNAPLTFAAPTLAGQQPRPPGRGEGSPP
jgi:pantoate--beta-alanine ligase